MPILSPIKSRSKVPHCSKLKELNLNLFVLKPVTFFANVTGFTRQIENKIHRIH